MASGQSVYQGAYNFPVQSTAAQSIMQGAQAQAQMYSSLGQALGKVANTYFEKKDEDKQIDAIVDNPEILDLVYRGQTDMPADPKERRKDVKALFKALGGRVGVENYLLRDRAEQRAQEGADRLKRAEDRIIQMEEDTKSYFKSLTERPDVTTTETREVGRIGGGTLGQYLPLGRKTAPPPGVDESLVDVSYLESVLAGDSTAQPTPKSRPSYLSKLKKGIGDAYQSASERLAKVEVPEIPLAEAETTTRPGQSLLARSTEMTGPAFLETWAERNPNATVGMMELARQSAAGLPQREAEAPQVVSQDGYRYMINPRTKEVISGSISTTTGAAPTFEQLSEIEDRDTELTFALENIKRVMDIFKVDAEGRETGEVNKWLVGPGIMDKSRRALADIGITGLDSDELLDNRDYLEQFATRTALEASQMLKGSLSEGELNLLMRAAPKMNSTSSEWRRYIVKLNRMINTEKLKNDRLRGASSGNVPGGASARGNLNLTSDQIVKDVQINADWKNRSLREKEDILKKVSARQDSSPEIIAKAVKILKADLSEETPPPNGDDKADLMKIADMTVPTAEGLKSDKLSGEIGGFIEVLSNVMREAIETGAIPRDEFAGPDNVWYGEFPDPLRQENYEKLIVYAKESLSELGSRAAARNMGTTPSPSDHSLFDYLVDFATALGGRTQESPTRLL